MTPHYQLSGGSAAEISASVEAGLRSGALAAGDRLPPVRQLATRLGVSPATAAAAYRSLRQRGVVETGGRNGTRVRGRPAVAPRSARLLPVPRGVRDLCTGGPDPRLLPPLGPRLRRITPGPMGYDGVWPLPELIALARERFAADGVPTGDLTVTGGALDGIERVLQAHLAPGDRVAVEDPGWGNLLDLVSVMNLRPVPVAMDEAGPTADGVRRALRSGARALVVTSRAHNPTGAAITPGRARELRGILADAPDTLVLEDDHAAELAEVPLASVAGTTRLWAFVRSVSKPYGPDLRVAVLAGDAATVGRVQGRIRVAGWVSSVLQELVVALWRDPVVARLVASARTAYQARRDGLIAALGARGVPAVGRTGINVWVPVRDETSPVAALRDAGWAVAPGAAYRLASPPGLRITVSALDMDDIEPLADDVAAAVTQVTGRYSV